MATRTYRLRQGTDTTDRRWLLRGAGAGAGVMIVSVLVIVVIAASIIGDGSLAWADQKALVGVVSTVIWSLVAAAAGAVGAWQAAVGGAPHPAAARFAGALGPVSLIAFVSFASLAIDGPGIVMALIQGIVEAGAAVAGAAALSRRLDAVW